jgi:hypothetical protein
MPPFQNIRASRSCNARVMNLTLSDNFTMHSQNRDPIDELALRLAAAYISYVAGKAGVDRTLKEIGKESPGELWKKLALTLMQVMAQGPPSGSDPTGTVH